MYYLPDDLQDLYIKSQIEIKSTLEKYSNVPRDEYLYELFYCLCTPQSSAANAEKVQIKLKLLDNFSLENVQNILSDREHYIRFHNQKAERIIIVKNNFGSILEVLDSSLSNIEKRNNLEKTVLGFGLKESSHYLRNIGYRNLAIIDRHLLKNLLRCNVISEIPRTITRKTYFEIEQKFLDFGSTIGIPIDELDLLFWSKETGFILK